MAGKKKALKRRTKKAARAKFARRPRRKTAARKGSTPSRRRIRGKTYEITITRSIACSDDQHVKRGKDSVFWTSRDQAYTVTFTNGWPFDPATPPDVQPATINVPQKGKSRSFKLDASSRGRQDYDIQPPPAALPNEKQPFPDIVGDP